MNMKETFNYKIRRRIEMYIAHERIKKVGGEPFSYGLNESKKRDKKIIISLTTFPARINNVSLCIKSLLRQTMKPDRVMLYLGSDVDEDRLPNDLRELEQYGLTVVANCRDIKPHKKYYYAMQEFPNDIVITTDDDIVYEPELVEELIKTHRDFPNAVICRRANIIRRDEKGMIAPYLTWDSCLTKKKEERYDLLPTGAGGILYPPHSISELAFNIDDIERYCLNADDVWLRYMGIKAGSPVVYSKPSIIYLAVIPGSQDQALFKSNVGMDKNDMFIKRMETRYGWSIDGK